MTTTTDAAVPTSDCYVKRDDDVRASTRACSQNRLRIIYSVTFLSSLAGLCVRTYVCTQTCTRSTVCMYISHWFQLPRRGIPYVRAHSFQVSGMRHATRIRDRAGHDDR